MSMTTLPGAEDKPTDTHVNVTYHNPPKRHLPPCNLNQSSDPLENHTVSSATATNISRPNVFSTNAVFATIWPQDIESWIAELPGRGSALVKRNSYSPNYDGYHDIYGFGDGNLNGENWLHGSEELHSDSIFLLINPLFLPPPFTHSLLSSTTCPLDQNPKKFPYTPHTTSLEETFTSSYRTLSSTSTATFSNVTLPDSKNGLTPATAPLHSQMEKLYPPPSA